MTQAPTCILLLDDDPDVGLAAQLLLQRRVAPLHCIQRPSELAGALQRHRPALVLLDMNFGPGRSDGAQGLHLLAQVMALPQPPQVIVMTAYAEIDLAVQAVKRGAWDFITKPWDNARLVAACHEALQQASPPAHAEAAEAEPPRSLAVQERAALLAAMSEAQGNLSAAARSLGISRAALYRRLDKHGL
ncbi:response regulator [Inhella gelatinilytica]|uniref:Response regulator n=1 Tax=Inhella gelatinilytica TaxID=2795030 RepID=A0A931NBZ7_9BURK|nr:response regulator [Inhella gelatinilytica]MBH9554133.1 response regulator [Inhella gelatinilytica]